MIRIAKSVVMVASVLALSACQSPTSSSSSSTSIDVTATTTPSFATARESSGVTYTVSQANAPDQTRTFPWQTGFAVSLKNNDSVGMNVLAVTVKVQQAISGIVVTSTTSEVEHYTYTFTPQSGSKRLEGNATALLDFTVYYALPNAGAEALITATIALENDNKAATTKTITLQVFPG